MAEWQSLEFKTYNLLEKSLVSDYLHSLKSANPAINVTDSSVSIYASNNAVLYNIENNENCFFNRVMNGIANKVRQYQGMDFDDINCTVNYGHGPTNDITINKDGVFETAYYKKELVAMVSDPQDDLDYDMKFVKKEYDKPFKIYDSDPDHKPSYETVIVESRHYEPFAVIKDYNGDKKTAWNEYDKYNDELFHHFYSDSNEDALNICDMFGVDDVRDQSTKFEKTEDSLRKESEVKDILNKVSITGIGNYFIQTFDGKNYQIGVSVPRSFHKCGFVYINCDKKDITRYDDYVNLSLDDKEIPAFVAENGKRKDIMVSTSELAYQHSENLESSRKKISAVAQKGLMTNIVRKEFQKGLGE